MLGLLPTEFFDSDHVENCVRWALGIEYDGTDYHGWQKQLSQVSVQSRLEKALSAIAGETVHTVCAGRTDSGVHASGQVVHFDTDVERPAQAWVRGVNSDLPASIRVHWARLVHEEFHARYSALWREYTYRIHFGAVHRALYRRYSTWTHWELDADLMAAAARNFVGRHDFSSFRASECQAKSPVRDVYRFEVIQTSRSEILMTIRANAFLHHMVRNMVAVLIEIGAGRRPVEWVVELLEAKDRTKAAATSAACGLCLASVAYPIEFGLPVSMELGD